MNATNYFETAILNSMRGVALTAPAKIYLALFLTDPTDSGQAGVEIAYPEYVRQEITFSAPASVPGASECRMIPRLPSPKPVSMPVLQPILA